MQKKTICVIIGAVILAAMLGAAATWAYTSRKQDELGNSVTAATVVPWDIEIEEEKIPENEGKIIIPGYAEMKMAANTKTQRVSMGNPASNDCYFVIALKLADGTLLYQSDYLKPGEGFYEIPLLQELQAGEYDAVIEYNCYTLEDKSPLNGGSCGFRLLVE